MHSPSKQKLSLHEALRSKSVTISQIKELSKGNINTADEDGNTPLHIACMHNPNQIIIKYLISVGADVFADNKENKIPFECWEQLSDPEEVINIVKFFTSKTKGLSTIKDAFSFMEKDSNMQPPLYLESETLDKTLHALLIINTDYEKLHKYSTATLSIDNCCTITENNNFKQLNSSGHENITIDNDDRYKKGYKESGWKLRIFAEYEKLPEVWNISRKIIIMHGCLDMKILQEKKQLFDTQAGKYITIYTTGYLEKINWKQMCNDIHKALSAAEIQPTEKPLSDGAIPNNNYMSWRNSCIEKKYRSKRDAEKHIEEHHKFYEKLYSCKLQAAYEIQSLENALIEKLAKAIILIKESFDETKKEEISDAMKYTPCCSCCMMKDAIRKKRNLEIIKTQFPDDLCHFIENINYNEQNYEIFYARHKQHIDSIIKFLSEIPKFRYYVSAKNAKIYQEALMSLCKELGNKEDITAWNPFKFPIPKSLSFISSEKNSEPVVIEIEEKKEMEEEGEVCYKKNIP